MEKEAIGSITKYFGELQDPRTGNAKAHIFLEILIIAICAVICGADGWSDIELFGKNKKDWLKTFLRPTKGIPSHDTFGRIFAKIRPEEFQRRFIEWVQAIEKLTAGQVIAVDGKKLRRSHDHQTGKEAIYMVSAWATENQLVLGQTNVADKSNEITAIPELLQLLDITGCIVTIDAIGIQTKIAETIVTGGGDYLLAVKENQGHLFEDIQCLFEVDVAYGIDKEGCAGAAGTTGPAGTKKTAALSAAPSEATATLFLEGLVDGALRLGQDRRKVGFERLLLSLIHI